MRQMRACLILLLGPMLVAADAESPAGAAIDLSSPRAAYISFLREVQAGDLKGMEKCVAPLDSDEQRNKMRAENWNVMLACALVEHFGPEKAAKYAQWAASSNEVIAQAQAAEEKVSGETAQLLRPNRVPIELRRLDGQWRMVEAAPPAAESERARQKADGEFAVKFLADLRAGKMASMADVEKALALHASALSVLRRVAPIYEGAKPDPAGLRIKVVATPAAGSKDLLFHVDAVLQNAGQKDIQVLLGIENPSSGRQALEHGSLEALGGDGVPVQVPMLRGMGYSGPPPVPWIVTLHPGDTFVLRPQMPFGAPAPAQPMPAAMAQIFAARGVKVPDPPPPYYLPPGAYTFTATYSSDQLAAEGQRDHFSPDRRGGAGDAPIWTGTVVSESVRIEVPAPGRVP